MKYQPKYKYYIYTRNDGSIVTIALSTYAKKPVKGIAVCLPEDEYDKEYGMALAAARCNEKVAKLRCKRANSEVAKAYEEFHKATQFLEKTLAYSRDADASYAEAIHDVHKLV